MSVARGRLLSLLVASAVAALSVLPSPAAADGGLTVVAVLSPPDRGVNETVDLDVEVYRWGAPADADTVRATLSFYSGNEISMSHVGTGLYHGSITLTRDLAQYAAGFSVYVQVQLGNSTASIYATYTLRSPATSFFGGTGALIRITNLESLGWFPSPGSRVDLETRTYVDGSLADVNNVQCGVSVYGGNGNSSNIQVGLSRVSLGVYTGFLDIPADQGTSLYSLSVFFQSNTGGRYGSGYGSLSFQVYPVPAVAWLENVTATSAAVRVMAGSATSALAGASVTVAQSYGYYGGNASTHTAVTDAHGMASVPVEFEAGLGATILANISSGSQTTSIRLYTSAGNPGGGWYPNYSGLTATVRPASPRITAGEPAVFTVHVEVNGTPLYARRLTRVVYANERPGMTLAGNVTTGPDGNFTVSYPVPADWRPDERLMLHVLAPEGEQLVGVPFDASPIHASSRLPLNVTYDATSRNVHIAADFTGGETVTGATAIAMLLPGNPFAFGFQAGGKPLFAALPRSGARFVGDLAVPTWVPDGSYTVIVRLANGGTTESVWDLVDAWNTSSVTVTTGPAKPTGPGLLPGGFVPGFGALAAGLAVVAAAVATTARRSRNRG